MDRGAQYGRIAPFYDLLSAEWPVYGIGRRAGIEQLRLEPGQCVLDIGCGTGLNLPLLRRAVGSEGVVVGVDRSLPMLRRARARIRRSGWSNVRLLTADATSVPVERILHAAGTAEGGRPEQVLPEHLPRSGVDAVVFTYSLSLMHHWERAWQAAVDTVRPGGRVVVVDMARPTGAAAVFSPLARVVCATAGSDIDAHPWTAMSGLDDVSSQTFRGGHVQVWAGTVSAGVAPGSSVAQGFKTGLGPAFYRSEAVVSVGLTGFEPATP